MLAVEMSSPIQCNFPPFLKSGDPASLCRIANRFLPRIGRAARFGSWTLAGFVLAEKSDGAGGGGRAQSGCWPGTNLGHQQHAARWSCW